MLKYNRSHKPLTPEPGLFHLALLAMEFPTPQTPMQQNEGSLWFMIWVAFGGQLPCFGAC